MFFARAGLCSPRVDACAVPFIMEDNAFPPSPIEHRSKKWRRVRSRRAGVSIAVQTNALRGTILQRHCRGRIRRYTRDLHETRSSRPGTDPCIAHRHRVAGVAGAARGCQQQRQDRQAHAAAALTSGGNFTELDPWIANTCAYGRAVPGPRCSVSFDHARDCFRRWRSALAEALASSSNGCQHANIATGTFTSSTYNCWLRRQPRTSQGCASDSDRAAADDTVATPCEGIACAGQGG